MTSPHTPDSTSDTMSTRAPADVTAQNTADELPVTMNIISAIKGLPQLPVDKDVFYNQETLKYMKIIDTYKKLGIGKHIELPRLVIAGTQSCGKSSLLENLTGLPVPITTGIGTRFPIEIVLIQDSKDFHIKPSIVRDPKNNDLSMNDLTAIEKFNLAQVYHEPLSKVQFQSILREVSVLLGVRTPVFATEDAASIRSVETLAKEISTHTLQFEMRGPQYRSLSFVDTPGLYSTHTRDQTAGPVAQIENLIASLINEKRTVIITVMEAGQLSATQKILGLAGDADSTGDRTLGVMTKCDLLKPSETDDLEAAYRRARNEERVLKHGWYLVKNRSSSEAKANVSLEEARKLEKVLFEGPAWKPDISRIKSSRMGIDGLKTGLSNVFCAHIRSEFPIFHEQTRSILADKNMLLKKLGPQRNTISQQRDYLKTFVTAYQVPKRRCQNDTLQAPTSTTDPTLLFRLLDEKKKTMLRNALLSFGTRWTFQDPKMERDVLADTCAVVNDTSKTPKNIYQWIAGRYQSTKTMSLPGLVNPLLVHRLFEEQTVNWKTLTDDFLTTAKNIIVKSIEYALNEACHDPALLDALQTLLRQEIDKKMATLNAFCHQLIRNEQDGQLIAGEEQFIREVQEARIVRFISALARLEDMPHLSVQPSRAATAVAQPATSIFSVAAHQPSTFPFDFFPKPELSSPSSVAGASSSLNGQAPVTQAFGSPFGQKTQLSANANGSTNIPAAAPITGGGSGQARLVDFAIVLEFAKVNKEQLKTVLADERQVVFEIHDILHAYYRISVQHYTDSVCKNGLTRDFVNDVLDIFSDKFVDSMSDATVERIASETVENRKMRRELNEDINRLKKALAESEAILSAPMGA